MDSYSIITEYVLKSIMPQARPEDVSDFVGPINDAMREFGVTTPTRQAAFLGQFAEESDQLWHLRDHYGTPRGEEYSSGEQYNGRADLGNGPHDGPLYKGRGLPQLTGKSNYAKYGRLLGVDLVANPKLLLDPTISARAAGCYFKTHGCNELADAGDFITITKRINGGTNGIERREAFWAVAKTTLAI